MNQLSCKSCGSALQVDGFDRRLAVVHCSHCGVLFDLTKPRTTVDVNNQAVAENAMSTGVAYFRSEHEIHSRPVAAIPAGFKVTENGKLAICWSWRGYKTLLILLFAVCFNIVILSEFISEGFELVHVLHVLAGIAFLYGGVAGVFNTTTIAVDKNKMTIRHGPVPWFRAPIIDASLIEQLFVNEEHIESKDGIRISQYFLNAVMRDNSMKRLSYPLPKIEQALYLEQEFERVLRIRDRRVAGEVRGPNRHI